MSANRKLQSEIQQVLKKVEEGVEIFDDIWSKVREMKMKIKNRTFPFSSEDSSRHHNCLLHPLLILLLSSSSSPSVLYCILNFVVVTSRTSLLTLTLLIFHPLSTLLNSYIQCDRYMPLVNKV